MDPSDQWARVEIDETLVGRRAGASAAAKAEELRREHPLRSLLANITRAPSESRSWKKGATGERIVGLQLRRLDRTTWHVFHDVPVGSRGANIDHVVIGPAGVFTVNTKHRKGRVVVTPRSLTVEGYRTDYLPKSVQEARRAADLLTRASGRYVLVRPVLAMIVDDLEIKDPPTDVTVVGPGGLIRWLREQPASLLPADVAAIAGAAHKPSTWSAR
jgi:hypothetical protein